MGVKFSWLAFIPCIDSNGSADLLPNCVVTTLQRVDDEVSSVSEGHPLR